MPLHIVKYMVKIKSYASIIIYISVRFKPLFYLAQIIVYNMEQFTIQDLISLNTFYQ